MTTWNFASLERILRDFDKGADLPEKKARKRDRILRAANELILKHGYRRTSMDEVARKAGVAKGTVYLYFKDKADLLIQLIVEEKKRYIDRVQPAFDPESDPKERLRIYMKILFVMAPEMPLISRLMTGDREIRTVMEEMEPSTRDRSMETMMGFLSHMIDQAAAPHELTQEQMAERARVLAGIIHSTGYLMEEHVRFGLSAERYAAILADMIVNGVVSGTGSGSG